MHALRPLLLTVIALIAHAIPTLAQADWAGSYYFSEEGGKTAGGTPIVVMHRLDVFDSADGLAATLQSNGYQTAADLVCTVKLDGPRISIYFQSYGENNMFEPYQPGDLLFSLERKYEKGKLLLLTHWQKLMPGIPKYAKSGRVYFEKATQDKL